MISTLEKPRTRRTTSVSAKTKRPTKRAVPQTDAPVKKYSILEDPEFLAMIEEGTKVWADVPDHVAWVRELRNM